MKTIFINIISRYRQEELGATAVEYGLLIALISFTIMAVVFSIGEDLEGFFLTLKNYIASVL